MWVLVKKCYAGILGLYPGDQKHDLDEKTIIGLRKKLGKENVIDTCAPEDEQKDVNAELKAQAVEAIDRAKELRTKADQQFDAALRLASEHTAAGELCTKGKHKINLALKDNAKPNLAGLTREQTKNVAALYIAGGRLEIADGENMLAELEAEDAERKAVELAEKAGIKFEPAKPVEPEAAGNTQ